MLALGNAARDDVTLRVFSSGGGDFSSVQAALDSLAPGSSPSLGHVTLQLKGTFWERVNVYSNFSWGVDLVPFPSSLPSSRPLIIFNVSGAGGGGCGGAGGPGTFGSYTVQVNADNVRMRDFDIANSACAYNHKAAGQSVALDIRGDRAAFFGMGLFGSQDTLYTGGGAISNYFADLYINGTCDAIFGSSSAVFERARIFMDFTVTAQRGSGNSSYLFLNSSVDTLSTGPGTLYLGRPWGSLAKTVFSGCSLGAGVAARGWDDWSHNCSTTEWCNSTFYAEYNNSGPGWVPSKRPAWTHVLSASQGAQWTVESVLGAWKPQPPP